MNAEFYFNGAELSLASYVNLIKGWSKDISRDEYISALKDDGKGMSNSQAESFVSRYSVVDQYSDSSSGFSATVFADKNGKRYLAIRGTQLFLPDIMDLIEDASLALTGAAGRQIISLYNYVQRLMGGKNTPVSQLVFNNSTFQWELKQNAAMGILDTALTEAVDVVGHSLGGHLAANDDFFRRAA